MQLTFVFHLLGAILWVGGILLLSRIMVLHAKDDGHSSATYSLIERKVDLFAIIGLALIVGSGLYQLLVLWPDGGFRAARWMHHKITLVLVLFVLHVLLLRTRRRWERMPPGSILSKRLPLVAHSLIGLCLIGILALVYGSAPHFLRSTPPSIKEGP